MDKTESTEPSLQQNRVFTWRTESDLTKEITCDQIIYAKMFTGNLKIYISIFPKLNYPQSNLTLPNQNYGRHVPKPYS